MQFVPADWCRGDSTVLGRVASALAPGGFAQLPENESLAALELAYSLLYWNDSAVWNAATRQIHWVGGPGTCCADPATFQRMTYDVATDTWSVAATPFTGSGHAYDGNAFDPTSQTHYFALFQDAAVKRFVSNAWADPLPDLPWNDIAPAVGLAWFPEPEAGRGGLVHVNGDGRAAFYDGRAWLEIDGSDAAPWGSYNLFAEHDPVHGVLWLGAGNDAEEIHYRLDSALELQRLADAPFSLNNGKALHAADPVSGAFIVTNTEAASWWEFDATDDVWTPLEGLADVPGFSGSQFQVPIADCGVILYLDHYHENRNAYLYRHRRP